MDPEGEILSLIIISAELFGGAPVDATLDNEVIVSSDSYAAVQGEGTISEDIIVSLDAQGGNPVEATLDESFVISSDSYAAIQGEGTISEEIVISSDIDGDRGNSGTILEEISILMDGDGVSDPTGDVAALLVIECSIIVDNGYTVSGSIPITVGSLTIVDNGYVVSGSLPITISSDSFAAIQGTGEISKNIAIGVTCRGGFYNAGAVVPRFSVVQFPIPISANARGGLPQTINSNVIISATAVGRRIIPTTITINAQAIGIVGNIGFSSQPTLDILISSVSFAQYGALKTGTINAPITISSSASGRLFPSGALDKQVVITADADGLSTAVESLYGRVVISSNALGGVRNQGTISKSITISSTIGAQTQIRSGTLSRPIIITPNIQGRVNFRGVISAPIIVAARSTNRAVSFLNPTTPVPITFRHGSINTSVIITATATTADQVPIGSAVNAITVSANISGRVLLFAGAIASPVIIISRAYDVDYGVSVPKATADIVLQENIFGINLPKSTVQAVVQQPQRLIASKSVAYAVIASGEEINPGYQAILFF